MQKPQLAPKKPSRSRAAWWIIGAVAALAVAFVVGRLTSEPAPAARITAEREVAQAPVYEAPAQQPSAWARPAVAPDAPQAAEAPAPPPSRPDRSGLPLERIAQYRTEVVAHVEQQRPRVVSTCWPKEGLPKGGRATTVTYNVTFNPQGREVGRGIVEDRRSPAGSFGRCLSRLQGMPFTISPPGKYVTLRIPVTYP